MKAYVLKMKGSDFVDIYELLRMIDEPMCKYNFLLTDYECYPEDIDILNRLKDENVWINGEELCELLRKEKIQWIWGVFSAFDIMYNYEDIIKEKIPYADGNKEVWNTIEPQHPLAEIEIVVGDNTLLILKVKNEQLVKRIVEKFSNIKEII